MNSPKIDDFFDIYDMWYQPLWQRSSVKCALGLLTIGAVAIIVWRLVIILKKRKKKTTPWDNALYALNKLKNPTVLNSNSAKVFYTNLTNILKKYIEDRFNFDIIGKTDNEILSYLEQQISFNCEMLPFVHDILKHAAHVKFANVPAMLECMDKDLNTAIMFVHQTMTIS